MTALIPGVLVGTVIGLCHAWYTYRQVVRDARIALQERPVMTRIRAGYCALWTLLLWVIFGSYVLLMWVLAVVAYGAYKAARYALSASASAPARSPHDPT